MIDNPKLVLFLEEYTENSGFLTRKEERRVLERKILRKVKTSQKGCYMCNQPVTDEMESNSTLLKRKSNVTKNGSKKMKGNASETVTDAKNAMNKIAPPGDVNNSNMCNNTVNNDTAFEIQLDDDTTLKKSSRTKIKQSLPIMLRMISN